MINSFVVKACPLKNQLKVTLDGYFMKSEIELAMHLAKIESSKLKPEFDVIVDIQHLKSETEEIRFNLNRLKNLIKKIGGGRIRICSDDGGYISQQLKSVGFYPFENTWLLP